MEHNEAEEHNNIYAYIQAQFQPLYDYEPKKEQIYHNAHIRKTVSDFTVPSRKRCYIPTRSAARAAPKAVKCPRIIFKYFQRVNSH